MHSHNSFPTSDRSIRWIESLADQEAGLEAVQTGYDLCATRDEILLSETVNFLNEIRYHTEYMVRLFNGRLSSDSLRVKFSKNGEPQEGFTLSRNEVVFQAASRKPGSIQLHCTRVVAGVSEGSVLTTGLVEASFTPFHDLQWTFLGENVTSEKAACHFLTEFLQLSRGH